jgi:hypothetical protein
MLDSQFGGKRLIRSFWLVKLLALIEILAGQNAEYRKSLGLAQLCQDKMWLERFVLSFIDRSH